MTEIKLVVASALGLGAPVDIAKEIPGMMLFVIRADTDSKTHPIIRFKYVRFIYRKLLIPQRRWTKNSFKKKIECYSTTTTTKTF